MLNSLRNFSRSKIAWVFIGMIILPFVFWGMGGVFNTGNTNVVAKVNETKISTQEFIDYLNNTNIPQKTIKENLDKQIIEELLSGLISTTLLDLEIKDFDFSVSQNILLKKIKTNKNFSDENGIFQRTKYEKFLLENNQTAAQFELRLKNRELQKNLFDYIGAGTVNPNFLINKLYEEENKKLEIEFINLKNFYKKRDDFSDKELKDFITKNKEKLKVEYIGFNYAIINPLNIIGIDEFNQSFFDKIDQIEIDISNEVKFDTIVSNLNIIPKKVKNFKFSEKGKIIEKKIFELRNNKFDIFESGNDYILYEVNNINLKEPDINDDQIKNEILELVTQQDKFDYNTQLLDRIKNDKFTNEEFTEMSQGKVEIAKLNSIRDNNKFEINAVEILYSLPINSFTLINDEKDNIYLAKIKNYEKETIKNNSEILKKYTEKQNSNSKNTLLKSYDLFLNNKYNIVLNQKTIERVKNFFR